jgi:hypothetical protein
MASQFTHLKEGKRCWNNDSIFHLQEIVNDESNCENFNSVKEIYWRLHSFLASALSEVGFEWASSKKDWRGKWELKNGNWCGSVQIYYDSILGIEIKINNQPYFYWNRDIFNLWSILRKSYLESKVKSER